MKHGGPALVVLAALAACAPVACRQPATPPQPPAAAAATPLSKERVETVVAGLKMFEWVMAHTRPSATPPTATVAHVVLVWLKQPGDPAARQALIDASRSLAAIPGVVDVRAGPVLPSTRPVVDSTYDVGMVITFTDPQALQDYLTHPTHLKLVDEVLKPNTDHYKVYDFALPK